MQRSLRTRIDELEKSHGKALGFTAVIRSIVSPGPTGPVRHEPLAIRDSNGWRLEREPGEAIDAFRDRAATLAPRRSGLQALVEMCDVNT